MKRWLSAAVLWCALLPSGCMHPGGEERITFVVMGDNRGSPGTAEQPVAFHDLLREVGSVGAELVWNTGDMIYGMTNDIKLVARQWDTYRAMIAALDFPVYHVSGNHDVWSPESRRVYESLWGPPHYVVDRGSFRFIALDTESDAGRLGAAQTAWLEARLDAALGRRVFVILHRPLFPAASHVETSLDVFPEERDALHRLFVRYRDRIAAVFAGHEHLYHHKVRDGIAYYTTGGGGADLHVPPERGGIHHFLLVRASRDATSVQVSRTGCHETRAVAPRRLRPGETVERWDSGLLWHAWDYTVRAGRTLDRASDGSASMELHVDFRRCGWPVLYARIPTGAVSAVSADVFLPPDTPPGLTVTTSLSGEGQTTDAESVALTSGWNVVRAEFPAQKETWSADLMQWVITASTNVWCGTVGFDRIRVRGAGDDSLAESWEQPLWWNTWPETTAVRFVEDGGRRLRVDHDPRAGVATMLMGHAAPPLDASKVDAFETLIRAPANPPSIAFVARCDDVDHVAPPLVLRQGLNHVRVALHPRWLPDEARGRIEQVAWRMESAVGSGPAYIEFGALRAAEEEVVP